MAFKRCMAIYMYGACDSIPIPFRSCYSTDHCQLDRLECVVYEQRAGTSRHARATRFNIFWPSVGAYAISMRTQARVQARIKLVLECRTRATARIKRRNWSVILKVLVVCDSEIERWLQSNSKIGGSEVNRS